MINFMTTHTSNSIIKFFNIYYKPKHTHQKPIRCLLFSVIEFYDVVEDLRRLLKLKFLLDKACPNKE